MENSEIRVKQKNMKIIKYASLGSHMIFAKMSLRETLLNVIVSHAVIETGKESEMDWGGENNFNRMYLYRIWWHEREIESDFQSLSWYVTEYHLDGFQYIAAWFGTL